MALMTVTPTLPNQKQGAGDDLALTIELFTGEVEGTIKRVSAVAPYIQMRPVIGTSTLTNEGIGESTLQVLKKGEAPDATINQMNHVSLTVDTTVIARNWVAEIDVVQKNYNVRAEIADEHGKKIGKFVDNALAIMATRAGMMTASAYGLPGHNAAVQVALAAAADRRDPASLIAALQDLFQAFEENDVSPQGDGLVVAVRPDVYYTLSAADELINEDYITSQGVQIFGAKKLKAFNVPVISSNNVPYSNVTNHFLSNARNNNAFNVDASKLVATAFSPKAIMAGESIPLRTAMWWDDKTKGYFIDAWLAFSATPNRVEYAGTILEP